MDGALALLYCPEPCCKLSFSGFLLSYSLTQQRHIGINVDH